MPPSGMLEPLVLRQSEIGRNVNVENMSFSG